MSAPIPGPGADGGPVARVTVPERDAPAPTVRHVEVFRGRPAGGRGYLLIDNRVSGGTLEERATLTCAHCGSVVVLHPRRARRRGFCFSCFAYVCDAPGCSRDCYSIKRCLDLMIERPDVPALPRTKTGDILFDPELLRKRQF